MKKEVASCNFLFHFIEYLQNHQPPFQPRLSTNLLVYRCHK